MIVALLFVADVPLTFDFTAEEALENEELKTGKAIVTFSIWNS